LADRFAALGPVNSNATKLFWPVQQMSPASVHLHCRLACARETTVATSLAAWWGVEEQQEISGSVPQYLFISVQALLSVNHIGLLCRKGHESVSAGSWSTQ
jgi:hypothetical protein